MNAAPRASIPSPSGAALDIGPVELRAYGLLVALGVIVAVWLCGRMLERKGIGTTDDANSIGIWSVVAGLIGTRLYHVATEWPRFRDDRGSIPKIWEGGLGIPGGFLAGVLVGLWQGKRRGIAPLPLLTCGALAIPLAQAIGRGRHQSLGRSASIRSCRDRVPSSARRSRAEGDH